MASFAILNVFGSINITFVEQKFGNINIQHLKFKLLIIIIKSYNMISVIWNFIRGFFLFIETKTTCLKTQKNCFW